MLVSTAEQTSTKDERIVVWVGAGGACGWKFWDLLAGQVSPTKSRRADTNHRRQSFCFFEQIYEEYRDTIYSCIRHAFTRCLTSKARLSLVTMHLMYNEDPTTGKRTYTLKKVLDGVVTKSAHPARFSPDDKYSRYERTRLVETDE